VEEPRAAPMLIAGTILVSIYLLYPTVLLVGMVIAKYRITHYNVDNRPFVSVVVAAHNHQSEIERFLTALLQQKYDVSRFEIILVDDGSTDLTLSRAQEIARCHPNRLTVLENQANRGKSRKKSALALGIQSARGEWIALTDADTTPPASWLQALAEHMHPQTVLIAGYSPQQSHTSTWWSDFLVTDSLASAFVAAGTISWNFGVTCTGRNLAYRRQEFCQIGGFAATPDTLSGDDDFILQKIAKSGKGKLVYAFTPASHIPATGPATIGKFLAQKQRHLSAGKKYSRFSQFNYAVFHLCNLLLIGAGLYGLGGNIHLFILLPIKALIDVIAISVFCRLLGSRLSLRGWLLWEIGFPLVHLLAAPKSFFGRVRWKSDDSNVSTPT